MYLFIDMFVYVCVSLWYKIERWNYSSHVVSLYIVSGTRNLWNVATRVRIYLFHRTNFRSRRKLDYSRITNVSFRSNFSLLLSSRGCSNSSSSNCSFSTLDRNLKHSVCTLIRFFFSLSLLSFSVYFSETSLLPSWALHYTKTIKLLRLA